MLLPLLSGDCSAVPFVLREFRANKNDPGIRGRQTVEKSPKGAFPPNKSTSLAKPSFTHFIFDKMQAARVRNKAKPFPIHLLG